MTTTFNGTTGITYPDGSTQASAQVGMKNRLIDAGFIINQRGYVSGTALAAGAYAHDRWKAGSGGCTYTFTQGALGVNTTITITAGTLVQVIEGCNLAEGGTYVLSWTGTAQGRLNGGSYGASGSVVITGWTAGTNLNVEFNTGTLGSVQLEKGSTATSFDYRPYGTELALCQRYYQQLPSVRDGSTLVIANYMFGNSDRIPLPVLPVQMRSIPTITSYRVGGTASGETTEFSSATNRVVTSISHRDACGGGYFQCSTAFSNPTQLNMTISAEL